MKKFKLLTFVFICLVTQLVSGQNPLSKQSETPNEISKSENNLTNPQITIYYGLNDSHSRSWAQVNKEGIIGITYFQRFENSAPEGTLIYKTILSDGTENTEEITTGTRMEKSVLLYDSLSNPHIFVAHSNNEDQIIDHYYKAENNQWLSETIIHFYNEGGRFIYELSADVGPNYSFHLLILKTRSDIDSDDFMDAWINSYLYHITNVTGSWVKELIHNYDMAYTYDMYIKTSSRQDIKIDEDGFVHVTFSEQINAENDPSRLLYATNKTGVWEIETALNYDYGIRDDAGWFPSLCLDNNGTPYISCMYINRVYTYSAVYCKLYLLKRLGNNNWQKEIVAEHDDGYYGSDGRNYTGGLTHLVFDENNTPRIIFSDIASTHWPHPENQLLNIGNIRYGILEDGVWNITTIYRQPLPTRFFIATEMYGMCLLISQETNSISVIGQELVITQENQYSCNLLSFSLGNINNIIKDPPFEKFELNQNYPNPFHQNTKIEFTLNKSTKIIIKFYDSNGRNIKTLLNESMHTGSHEIIWDGKDDLNRNVPSGIYFYQLVTDSFSETKKLILIK
ncbi:T9SS type A sorting domain-containing protein [Bacteroidota bacterium]